MSRITCFSCAVFDEKLPDNVAVGINYFQQGGKGPDGAEKVEGSMNIEIKNTSHGDIDHHPTVVSGIAYATNFSHMKMDHKFALLKNAFENTLKSFRNNDSDDKDE